MNESITFGELLSMNPDNITGKKPTEKYLRENETVIAVSPDKRVTAYQNGYASYKGYPDTIVLNIHDCFFCTYEAKKWVESVRKEQALKLKWYLLIFMRGEEELALNQCYREETRHRYKNDEDAFCEEVPDREPPPDIQVHSKIFVEELMQPLKLLGEYYHSEEMLEKWNKGELNFTPDSPMTFYNMQIKAMTDYKTALELRAEVEDVKL